MTTLQLHRLVGIGAGLVLAVAVAAPAALGKEGVEVTLAAPISRDAKPGDVVAVFFTLASITDTGSTPLRGSDVFLRLFGPTGARAQASGVEQPQPGLYQATIAIPAGGSARAEFGIHGSATDASGRTIASDVIWPYDGILVTAAAPAPAAVAPERDPAAGGKLQVDPIAQPAAGAAAAATAATGSTGLDLQVTLVGALAVGIALTAALAVGRRRFNGSAA